MRVLFPHHSLGEFCTAWPGVTSWLAAIACLVASPLPVLGANWPAWRGDGGGVSDQASLPVVWNASKNILWSTEIEGSGVSSPIVWGNRVFTRLHFADAFRGNDLRKAPS